MRYLAAIRTDSVCSESADEEDTAKDFFLRARQTAWRLEQEDRARRWKQVFQCVIRIVGTDEQPSMPLPIRQYLEPSFNDGAELPSHDFRASNVANFRELNSGTEPERDNIATTGQ